ncbi:hypothetical protein [Variovorax saccharolyticus]|uniref:hypothetical protein n=1 Tax=Variovorax saccharolyticus TaxID=3053516 RepID=UPI002578B013|nr:hypothetical protein [Variovorax sp. J31P216]MDM0026609.1 hypothetical protein [Variovorax sp. J31P216]
MNRMLLGYSPDFDLFEDTDAAGPATGRASRKAVVFDTESAGLAAELLNAADGPHLAATLRRLVRVHAAPAAVGPAAAELVALLRGAARQALPLVTAATARQAGTTYKRMGRFFGIELEGLTPEDQEFELARRFAQLVREAARQLARAPAGLPPAAAARWAAGRAARRLAPGWTQVRDAAGAATSTSAGRWVRHGAGVTVLNP